MKEKESGKMEQRESVCGVKMCVCVLMRYLHLVLHALVCLSAQPDAYFTPAVLTASLYLDILSKSFVMECINPKKTQCNWNVITLAKPHLKVHSVTTSERLYRVATFLKRKFYPTSLVPPPLNASSQTLQEPLLKKLMCQMVCCKEWSWNLSLCAVRNKQTIKNK